MTGNRPRGTLLAFAEEVLALAHALDAAEAPQWLPSQTPKPRDDTTERASGGHSDPTASTVIDDRRLDLRAAVESGNRAVLDALEVARRSRLEVEGALARWAGDL